MNQADQSYQDGDRQKYRDPKKGTEGGGGHHVPLLPYTILVPKGMFVN
jgi:hypothetical protein